MQDGIIAGIVAEYNPFHKGHGWMIHELRKGGVGAVVCVLSGPFVQRAEPAVFPVYARAKAALLGGADLVLRLPVPWAVASAEGFATGAVGLLSALGCVDLLAFGAETPKMESLEEVAALLLREDFKDALHGELKRGLSFAAARGEAAEKMLPGARKLLQTPNNILGVEYCKALMGKVPDALKKQMPEETKGKVVTGLYGKSAGQQHLFALPVPLAMPRTGAQHDGQPVGHIASASWLRAQVQAKNIDTWQPYVPQDCEALYSAVVRAGETISPERWEVALLSRLKGKTPAQFGRCPGAGEGLETRLAGAAKHAIHLEEMYCYAKSKRFAHSRVRRLALAAALELPNDAPAIPPFAQVLAASPKGLSLLKKCKQKALVPVSGSLAKLAKGSEAAAKIVALEAAAEDLYALCQQTPYAGGRAYTMPIALSAGNNKEKSENEEKAQK